MPALRIGVELASLGMPLKKGLLAAAQLGVQAVELDARGEVRPADLSQSALRHLRKMLDDLNLRVSAVSFLTRRGYDVPDELDRRVEATKQAMKMAYSLGADVVINQIGRVPDDSSGAAWQMLVASLSELGSYGQHVGARLAAETGTNGADLARLIAALPPGSLGVSLSPGQLIVNGFSPAEAVTALGAHIVHVHATDGVADRARGRGNEVPLGRGMADFASLLGQLEEHAYRGYFTIQRRTSSDPMLELGQAVKYLQSF